MKLNWRIFCLYADKILKIQLYILLEIFVITYPIIFKIYFGKFGNNT